MDKVPVEHLEKIPETYKLKGTEFVTLKMLSGGEQVPWIAQIRGLTGRHLHLFLRSTADTIWGKLGSGQTLTDAEMNEARDRAIAKTREIVAGGIVRLFEVNGESVRVYRVSDSPVGEHKTDEVSLDLLVGDYAALVVEIMRLSSLYMGGESADAEPFRPEDQGTAGRTGEEVRGEASRVG